MRGVAHGAPETGASQTQSSLNGLDGGLDVFELVAGI
jgi:hypothetical protein